MAKYLGYAFVATGIRVPMEAKTPEQQLAMLHILYGASTAALTAFRAADNPIDEQLVVDLDAMVRRTQAEIERLSARLAEGHSSPAAA